MVAVALRYTGTIAGLADFINENLANNADISAALPAAVKVTFTKIDANASEATWVVEII